jgi:hypothetical protein
MTMRQRLRSQALVATIAVAVLRCTDPGVSAPDTATTAAPAVDGLVISNSHLTPGSSAVFAGRASTSLADNEPVVFVSLAPGTMRDAVKFEIENQTQTLPAVSVPAIDGGFDPVRIRAVEGDMLAVTGLLADGRKVPMFSKVPAKRPPSIVRSSPSKGRTDVALNIVVLVVFTEPINRSTVNWSSIQLLHEGKAVAGTVIFHEDTWDAEFVPDKPLDPLASYELSVTRDVRDVDGDALDSSYTSSFKTGSQSCSHAADKTGCPPWASDRYVLTGTVGQKIGDGTRPVPNAMISAWIAPSGTASATLSVIQADANGTFRLGGLGAGLTVQLLANAPELDQPCGVAVDVTADDVTADIELVPSGTVSKAQIPKRIAGFLYEYSTRNRVAGARIWYHSPHDVIAASVTTDVNGNFALCNLPALSGSQFLSVSTRGYKVQEWIVRGLPEISNDFDIPLMPER